MGKDLRDRPGDRIGEVGRDKGDVRRRRRASGRGGKTSRRIQV